MTKQAIAHTYHQLMPAVAKGTCCIWDDKKAETLKSIWGELSASLSGWHMYLAACRLPVPWVWSNSWVILAV